MKKERPRVGDYIEFVFNGPRFGLVLAVASTGVHFRVEMEPGGVRYHRHIGITKVTSIILKGEEWEVKTT